MFMLDEKNLDCLVLDYRGFFGAPLNFLPHLPDPTPRSTVHLYSLATPHFRASQTLLCRLQNPKI